MPRSTPSLEEITRAAGEAGIANESEREEIARKLHEIMSGNRGTGRPPGRPPENDDERLLAVARLVRKGKKPHAAAKQVTAHLPESEKAAAAQRLSRKFRKDADSWISKAALTPTTIQEEIERLREQLGPSADRLDFGRFLRRIQQDPEF